MAKNFRRFFVRGLAALMPTLITLWLLIKVWDFLWESLGQYLIIGVRWIYVHVVGEGGFPPAAKVARDWDARYHPLQTKLVGVMLAILLVWVLGVFVGNFIGRSLYRLAETAVMRVPLIRAIYPAVKQVTDFVLAERGGQFHGNTVVAVHPHAEGHWSIGLVTSAKGLPPLTEKLGRDMVTVFIPSSPTAFSGYVVVVPRESVVELPMTVEEVMRLLVSGGVISPKAAESKALESKAPTLARRATTMAGGEADAPPASDKSGAGSGPEGPVGPRRETAPMPRKV